MRVDLDELHPQGDRGSPWARVGWPLPFVPSSLLCWRELMRPLSWPASPVTRWQSNKTEDLPSTTCAPGGATGPDSLGGARQRHTAHPQPCHVREKRLCHRVHSSGFPATLAQLRPCALYSISPLQMPPSSPFLGSLHPPLWAEWLHQDMVGQVIPTQHPPPSGRFQAPGGPFPAAAQASLVRPHLPQQSLTGCVLCCRHPSTGACQLKATSWSKASLMSLLGLLTRTSADI